MSMTLKLRAGVEFHDGTPCDAAAVKFNIERMMDKKRNTTNRPLWDPLAAVESPDPSDHRDCARRSAVRSAAQLARAWFGRDRVARAHCTSSEKPGWRRTRSAPDRTCSKASSPDRNWCSKAFDEYWGGKKGAERLVFRSIPEAATRISALGRGRST